LVDEIEHGNAVVETLDCIGGIDDEDTLVFGFEIEKLAVPIVGVNLVNKAVEGALIDERLVEINWDEMDASLLGESNEGRRD